MLVMEQRPATELLVSALLLPRRDRAETVGTESRKAKTWIVGAKRAKKGFVGPKKFVHWLIGARTELFGAKIICW